jgi:hypothetical protein
MEFPTVDRPSVFRLVQLKMDGKEGWKTVVRFNGDPYKVAARIIKTVHGVK